MLEQRTTEIDESTIIAAATRLIKLHNNNENAGTKKEWDAAIQASLITSNELVKVTGAAIWYRVFNYLKTLENGSSS